MHLAGTRVVSSAVADLIEAGWKSARSCAARPSLLRHHHGGVNTGPAITQPLLPEGRSSQSPGGIIKLTSAPSLGNSTRTVSPARNHRGDCCAPPTPEGVPVAITSPGSSVMNSLTPPRPAATDPGRPAPCHAPGCSTGAAGRGMAPVRVGAVSASRGQPFAAQQAVANTRCSMNPPPARTGSSRSIPAVDNCHRCCSRNVRLSVEMSLPQVRLRPASVE